MHSLAYFYFVFLLHFVGFGTLEILCLLFKCQSIHHEMIHPASKQWPSQADRAKAGQHGNIIKAKRRRKTDVDRPSQTLTPRFKSGTCCHCSLALRPPATQKFVTTLSGSFWAFLISSDFYFYPAPILLCPLPRPCSAQQTASFLCHLSSIYSITVLILPVCL